MATRATRLTSNGRGYCCVAILGGGGVPVTVWPVREKCLAAVPLPRRGRRKN
jgi:hypothetical protein